MPVRDFFQQWVTRSPGRLRPQMFVRQVCQALERRKRQGVDGRWYVANAITLRVAVHSGADREHVREFMDANDIAESIATWMKQRNYRTRGPLHVVVEEISYAVPGDEPIEIHVRFEANPADVEPGVQETDDRKTVGQATIVPTSGIDVDVSNSDVASSGADAVDHSLTSDVSTESIVYVPELQVPELRTPNTPPTQVVTERVVPHPNARRAYPYPDMDEEMRTVPAVPQAVATVRVTTPDGQVNEYSVGSTGLRIGRSRTAGNDLVIADPMVSKRHAELRVSDNKLVMVDLQSTNGTRLSGAPIPPGIAWPISEGDVFLLGNTQIMVVKIQASKLVPAIENYGIQSVARALSLMTADGQLHAIGSDMVIGRAISDDIVVSGVGVSPQHARLRIRHDVITIEDLDAPAGTFVNSERIPARHPVVIRAGDTVALGSCLMTVMASSVSQDAVYA
ncbi:MAG: FHA domain-containing protein [Armatimonadota bacterium]